MEYGSKTYRRPKDAAQEAEDQNLSGSPAESAANLPDLVYALVHRPSSRGKRTRNGT
jgi:hypothetical protein